LASSDILVLLEESVLDQLNTRELKKQKKLYIFFGS
jgi:hypothetical protein